MTDRPTIDPDTHRKVTAHHEAGHAVAAVIRGGSSLRSIDLSDAHNGHGLTVHRSKPLDGPFIAYAGPWAEARLGWPDSVPLDGYDDTGCAFEDHVYGVFLQQPDDAAAVEPHDHVVSSSREAVARQLADTPTDHPGHAQLVQLAQSMDESGPYDVWHRELEAVWPAIQTVAARLLAGDVLTDADVRRLVGR